MNIHDGKGLYKNVKYVDHVSFISISDMTSKAS